MNDPFCRAELTGPYNRRALTESDLTQAVDDAAMFAGQSAASAETAQAAALEAASVVAGVTGSADTAIAAAEAAAISEQDAAAHRTEAAGYAQQTEDDADRAGTSAFNAAASAAAAQSSEDDAEESATAAQASRVGAEAARGGAETAQAGAQGSQTAAEAAANLALAGQFLGTQVSNLGVDLDTLGPGVYRFNTAAATASLNTPINAAGVLTVGSPTGAANQLTQRYEPYASATSARVFYERMVSSAGGVWRTYAAQTVDQTAGRVITTWDDVNGRPQMIYGDTGWRNIDDAFLNGWTGTARIRRRDATVFLKIEGLNPAARTAQNALALPVGFRDVIAGGTRFTFVDAPPGAASTTYRSNLSSTMDVVAPTNAPLLYGSATWSTMDPWPSAPLPGIAVGGIPNL